MPDTDTHIAPTGDAMLKAIIAVGNNDPMAPEPCEVEELKKLSGLTKAQADFVESWILRRGDLADMTEADSIPPSDFLKRLAAPAVRNCLSRAAEMDPTVPAPVATKDEIAMAWSVIARSNCYPLPYQKEARQELAKLMGYYQTPEPGGVNVGVQIVLSGDNLA